MVVNRKKLYDKVVLVCWLAFLLLNVTAEFIKNTVGGIGVIAMHYIFMLYFLFVYGKRQDSSISMVPFFIFLVFYVIEYQFFWEAGRVYTSYGIDFNLQVWHMISLVPAIVSAIQMVSKSDNEMKKFTRVCITLMLVVVAFASIRILNVYPEAVRLNAANKGEYFPFLINYSLVYALTVVLSYLLASFSKIEKYKILHIIGFTLIMISIVRAAFTIALVTLLVCLGSYFYLKMRSPLLKMLLIVGIVAVILVLTQTSILTDFLYWTADILPMDEVSYRLQELAYYMETGVVGSAMGRFDRYAGAADRIIHHPLFGNILWNYETELSEHSTNLDIIDSCGLIVFVFYFKFLLNIYRYHKRKVLTFSQQAAVTASFISFLFVSTFNPVWSSPEVMVFLILGPLMTGEQTDPK